MVFNNQISILKRTASFIDYPVFQIYRYTTKYRYHLISFDATGRDDLLAYAACTHILALVPEQYLRVTNIGIAS